MQWIVHVSEGGGFSPLIRMTALIHGSMDPVINSYQQIDAVAPSFFRFLVFFFCSRL